MSNYNLSRLSPCPRPPFALDIRASRALGLSAFHEPCLAAPPPRQFSIFNFQFSAISALSPPHFSPRAFHNPLRINHFQFTALAMAQFCSVSVLMANRVASSTGKSSVPISTPLRSPEPQGNRSYPLSAFRFLLSAFCFLLSAFCFAPGKVTQAQSNPIKPSRVGQRREHA